MIDAQKLWNEAWNNILDSVEPVTQLPKQLVNGVFPPTDIYIDKDENLHIDMALAGFEETDLSMKFDPEGYLVIASKESTSDEDKTEDTDSVKRYVMKGIKRSQFSKSIFIDTRYFDKTGLDAIMKNGMLNIKIPKKPEDPNDTINIRKG
jgi:molecular chaperone IbpB/HSP20 family protein